jgi:hypothetical protein
MGPGVKFEHLFASLRTVKTDGNIRQLELLLSNIECSGVVLVCPFSYASWVLVFEYFRTSLVLALSILTLSYQPGAGIRLVYSRYEVGVKPRIDTGMRLVLSQIGMRLVLPQVLADWYALPYQYTYPYYVSRLPLIPVQHWSAPPNRYSISVSTLTDFWILKRSLSREETPKWWLSNVLEMNHAILSISIYSKAFHLWPLAKRFHHLVIGEKVFVMSFPQYLLSFLFRLISFCFL